jgi:hypothetical protein
LPTSRLRNLWPRDRVSYIYPRKSSFKLYTLYIRCGFLCSRFVDVQEKASSGAAVKASTNQWERIVGRAAPGDAAPAPSDDRHSKKSKEASRSASRTTDTTFSNLCNLNHHHLFAFTVQGCSYICFTLGIRSLEAVVRNSRCFAIPQLHFLSRLATALFVRPAWSHSKLGVD